MQSADVIFQAKQYINAIAQGIDPVWYLDSKGFLLEDQDRIVDEAAKILEAEIEEETGI